MSVCSTETEAPPRLELRDVRVRRNGRTVLALDRLALAPGEVVAVMGPNGAGKSTLLQVCAFLLRPDEGSVLLHGHEVHGTPVAARRSAALLLQSPVLFQGSVLQNVELGLRLRGVGRAERRERALHALSRFGIAELASRSSNRLSGGEKQRVALARSLASEPDIVLLDEPFSALDQPTRERLVFEAIAELTRLGSSVIFVTHERAEAFALAQRLVVLVGGQIRQEGAPAAIRNTPVDDVVASYVRSPLERNSTAGAARSTLPADEMQ